jgi:hypothetical protein
MLKVLLIDELIKDEVVKGKEYIKLKTIPSPINDLFWLKLPEEILEKEQLSFIKENEPLKIAIEIGHTWIKIELLIRSESLINIGGGDLTNKQFEFIFNFYNNLINYIKREI